MGVTWEELKDMDWSQFEGREFEYLAGGDMSFTAVIAIADKDLGITAVKKDFPDVRVICVNGPESPVSKIHSACYMMDYPMYAYKKAAARVIQSVIDGVYVTGRSGGRTFNPKGIPAGSCAFSQ